MLIDGGKIMTNAKADFVHLHVHMTYSLFDSTLRLSDIFKKAKEYQMPAIAIKIRLLSLKLQT